MELVKIDDIWQVTSDGKVIAYGNGGTVKGDERTTIYVVHEIATVATPKRESHVEFLVNNKRVAGGPARCERAGSRLLISGAGWRVEAGK